jgi:hypothetical protein
MSFRLFIYYCAMCGGWAAFFGWAMGKPFVLASTVKQDGIRGMLLGLCVALGLSALDAVWNLGMRRWGEVTMRVGVAVLVGCVAGALGGMLGSALYNAIGWPFFVVGWTLTGLLIGTSIGVFEVLSGLIRQQNMTGSVKKLMNGLIGGTAGGLLGGVLALLFGKMMANIFSGKDENSLWSPTALGFVALGMCIGLLIGLAQVILKEAWIKVEAGFRAGRELILSKEKTTVGRAESCDIGLFGDNTIERLHAQIVQQGNRYFLEDANTSGGTYLNDARIVQRSPLSSGDLIRVGRSVLRFRERQKRNT